MLDRTATSDQLGHALTRLGHELRHRPLLSGAAVLALVSGAFLLAPGVDLAVSRLFYRPLAGFSGGGGMLEFVRDAGSLVEWALVIAVILPLALKFLFPSSVLLLSPRVTLFVLATFALGPGLIVNGILKDHWGRARPRQIAEFGGDATFSPVWWISDQCARNCSFVSGEAAGAFCLVALVFLVRERWKPAVTAATLAFAAAVSFTRIAAGGHFLSDVLLAWLITLCIMIALSRLVLNGLPPAFDDAVERGAERWGNAIRGSFAR